MWQFNNMEILLLENSTENRRTLYKDYYQNVLKVLFSLFIPIGPPAHHIV